MTLGDFDAEKFRPLSPCRVVKGVCSRLDGDSSDERASGAAFFSALSLAIALPFVGSLSYFRRVLIPLAGTPAAVGQWPFAERPSHCPRRSETRRERKWGAERVSFFSSLSSSSSCSELPFSWPPNLIPPGQGRLVVILQEHPVLAITFREISHEISVSSLGNRDTLFPF